MALETLNPTNHSSPDSGGNAFSSHSNTGCSGGVIGLAGEPSNNPTYRAFVIPNSSKPSITEKRLKFTWAINIISGSTGSVTGAIEYSLNGGGSWTSVANLTNSSGSGPLDTAIPLGQDLSQVFVRAIMSGGGPSTGNERQMTLDMSNIRIEVTYTPSTSGASSSMM